MYKSFGYQRVTAIGAVRSVVFYSSCRNYERDVVFLNIVTFSGK